MERTERACKYHESGCNCCQSVLASFSDLTGLSEAESLRIGGGFGNGAGTGELCGAITGAVMALSMLVPVDPNNPAAGKREAVALSKEFQARFKEKFGALRCQELLPLRFTPDDTTPAAKRLGLNAQQHCRIMIVTAAEITEALIKERGLA
ncbi:MAG: C_GCAxxG_C_C family protein [Oscillibacter sp.]|nr:C_GCAxxG_C_C family protein [Oscillibacter sp.]MBQ7681416.1 C_GCAxxG_C_C family protein [Oscillibacter sp.]MBQ9617905.1 C_GCAxxG_C_C family protein [Oscillibacter sp.]